MEALVDSDELQPGPNLYAVIRARLITKGTTLNRWCQQNGVAHANARLALLGKWNGPKAQALRKIILHDAA